MPAITHEGDFPNKPNSCTTPGGISAIGRTPSGENKKRAKHKRQRAAAKGGGKKSKPNPAQELAAPAYGHAPPPRRLGREWQPWAGPFEHGGPGNALGRLQQAAAPS